RQQRLQFSETRTGPMKTFAEVEEYLRREQRNGRISPGASAPHVARLLLGACFGQAFFVEMLGTEGQREDDGQFARTIVRQVMCGLDPTMDRPEFEGAISWLVETSAAARTAVMCSETLWWRCHRRMIGDALTVRGATVVHLIAGKREAHRLHPNARVVGRGLVYDVPDAQR